MQHDELENISKAEIDTFISRIERGIVDDDDPLVDETDPVAEIIEGWKLEDALGGRAADTRQRLRTERADGTNFAKRATPTCSTTMRGEPGTRRQCNGWTLQFGSDGTVEKAWADGVDPESAFEHIREGR